MIGSRQVALTLIASLLVLSAVVKVHSQSGVEAQAGARSEDGRVAPTKDWPFFGGDWTNARYSTLNQLNTSNVKNLGGAWVSPKFLQGGSSRSTPIIKDGVMFVNAAARVYALNAKSGEMLWNWDSKSPLPTGLIGDSGLLITPVLNTAGVGIPNSPGVGLGEGMAFVGLMDGRVVALDQKTGELRWSTQVGEDPPKKGQSVAGSPTYASGIVFVGLGNGDWALRGRAVALDAKTGKELWHFFTIPAPNEPGGNTWAKDNDVWKRGGGGIWHTGVVDAELGMIYFQTGNAQPQYGGELRPGDNLYVACVIALDMKTGKLRWYYQVVHHDIWDADIATPLLLYDAQVGGRSRKALAAMRPDGYLFLFDRETGKPLFPVEERPVPQDKVTRTARTQPFPVGGESMLPACATYKDKLPPEFELQCDFAPPYSDKQNVVTNGIGVRVSPMSYNPQTGYIYAEGNGGLVRRARISKDPWYGGGSGHSFLGGWSLVGIDNVHVLAAMDSRTNKVVWKKDWPQNFTGGGTITTAGGLLFNMSPDGNFVAYDAKTGDRLWQFQTGMGLARGSAATYDVDGEQYVAVTVGQTVMAFKLGGTLPPLSAPAMPSAESRLEPIQNTTEIETTLLANANIQTGGHRIAPNEYSFSPTRARVKPGVRITWINNGTLNHTVVAKDGSWTTGTLSPAQEGYATFNTPGTYLYYCKEHPSTLGQIVVEP